MGNLCPGGSLGALYACKPVVLASLLNRIDTPAGLSLRSYRMVNDREQSRSSGSRVKPQRHAVQRC